MRPVKLPENELDRVKKLYSYDILDTLSESEYEDIVNLAANICETPIALISLVDTDRQWFKAKKGIENRETSRDLAFCAHTIFGDDLFVVPDLTKDERFSQNIFVTGPLHLNFYAGAPIITPDGFAIGALCVLDNTPRILNDKMLKYLQALSRFLVAILELRLKLKEGKENLLRHSRIHISLRKNEFSGFIKIFKRLSLECLSNNQSTWRFY